MEDVLRFDGSTRRDAAVDAWLDQQPGELGAMARTWFARFRACGDDVREIMHDGCPVACIADVPFGYVNVFRAHMNVGFYRGAGLDDPNSLLEGNGKRMRHVKLRPGHEPDTATLTALIAAAYHDARTLV
jgi:hypothetical protein